MHSLRQSREIVTATAKDGPETPLWGGCGSRSQLVGLQQSWDGKEGLLRAEVTCLASALCFQTSETVSIAVVQWRSLVIHSLFPQPKLLLSSAWHSRKLLDYSVPPNERERLLERDLVGFLLTAPGSVPQLINYPLEGFKNEQFKILFSYSRKLLLWNMEQVCFLRNQMSMTVEKIGDFI